MEKEVDPEIIKATQNSLGKYVKRPPLTEKLLKKPPFRFLHDIVTTVLKNSGFFEGLFEPEELISENVKDRDNKISFLNKVITVVGIATGETLLVKSSKIVAGQEPEKTNELLQSLARALDANISSNDAVKKYKESSKIQDPEKETKKTKVVQNNAKKLTSISSDKLTRNKKENRNVSVTRNEKNGKQKDLSTKNKKDSLQKKLGTQINSARTETGGGGVVQKGKTDNCKVEVNNIKKTINTNNNKTNEEDVKNDDNTSEVSIEIKNNLILDKNSPKSEDQLDQSFQENINVSYTLRENSLSSHDLTEIDNNFVKETDKEDNKHFENQTNPIDTIDSLIEESEVEEVKKSTRQGTPENNVGKTKNQIDIKTGTNEIISLSNVVGHNETEWNQKETEKHNEHDDEVKKTNLRPPSVRPSSSRPGAPRLRDKHDNVLISNGNLFIGKVNIIVENTPNEEDEDNSIIIVDEQDSSKSNQEQMILSSNRHGHLVQQILDSQRELSQTTAKTEIEWQFGAQKAREVLNQEIDQLRFNIQAVSRVANPLGKLLDHIQEDVEVMRQELQQWTKSYEEASKELLKQKQANENSLVPLHSKLKQLNVDIEEKHEKINDFKVIIYKNSFRIEKLLAGGNVQ